MISIYNDNYVLPFYYVQQPYNEIYEGTTPSNQKIANSEFKGQLSAYTPVFDYEDFSLNISFTLKAFWQLYTEDPWIRETNYNPQVFVTYKYNDNWSFATIVDHESNGRGGIYERYWDRLILSSQYKNKYFDLKMSVWPLVRNYYTTSQTNEQIQDYLGYENITAAYKIGLFESKVSIQNIEHPDKIQFIFTQSYRFYKDFGIYLQYFRGYGESLIEYNHFTQAFGIGIRFY